MSVVLDPQKKVSVLSPSRTTQRPSCWRHHPWVRVSAATPRCTSRSLQPAKVMSTWECCCIFALRCVIVLSYATYSISLQAAPPVPHQPPLSLEPAASLGASPQPLAVRGCAGLDAGHHGVAVRLSSAQYRVALSNTQQLRHLLCPERDLAAEHVVVRLLQVGDAAHLQQPAQCAR